MEVNYAQICKEVEEICKTVAVFINDHRNQVQQRDVETKSLNSLVSFVDKQAEEQLVKGLKAALPQAGFIAEEGTESTQGELYNWVVDPLDGTTNFLHGIPIFAISVALMREKELVIGIVLEIGQNECFSAWKEGGAFLNGHPISVKSTSELGDTLMATGFPYYNFNRMDEFLNVLNIFMEKTRGVRRHGSAATDLAYVACGRFDGFFEYGLSPWDVAAGALIVKEAGGKVCDYTNGDDYVFGGEIAATSSAIHAQFMEVIQSAKPQPK